jgi:hypothetical protein
MLGLCLIAAFAVVAIAATSASALPEWGQCFEQPAHLGKYTDANCTKKATVNKATGKVEGQFEFRKGNEISASQKKFAGANVGSGGLLTTEFLICEGPEAVKEHRISRKACEAGGGEAATFGTLTVECESESNHGETAGTKEVKNVSVKFLGCKLGATPCSNGTSEGEILVNTLKGSLGYINKATKEVGVLLTPAVKKGEFAKFTCAGTLTTVVGVGNEKEGAAYSPETKGGNDGIISPITPVNTMSKEFTQVYTVNANKENVPSKFEGKPIELLEDYIFVNEEPQRSSLWQKAGEAITNVNHQVGEEAVEIKA